MVSVGSVRAREPRERRTREVLARESTALRAASAGDHDRQRLARRAVFSAGHLAAAVARGGRDVRLALAQHRRDGRRSRGIGPMVACGHRADTARRPRSPDGQFAVRRGVRHLRRPPPRLRSRLAADRGVRRRRQSARRGVQPEDFRSIGASTATFAAVGIVGAFVWRRGYYRAVDWRRSVAPVFAAIAMLAFTGMARREHRRDRTRDGFCGRTLLRRRRRRVRHPTHRHLGPMSLWRRCSRDRRLRVGVGGRV